MARGLCIADRREYKSGKLGILRLDYDYPPAPGDIDHPGSFSYKVVYRMVPGLTFDMCQSGVITDEVRGELRNAVLFLVGQGVDGLTADCGFFMYLQQEIRTLTTIPVFTSALAQLPAVTCAFAPHERIAIFTANQGSLEPMRSLLRKECGVDPKDRRFVLVGCEDVDGFEAVALGEKVDTARVSPGIVAKALQVTRTDPSIRAILLECTELPPYSDAVRQATRLPVFDAITCVDFFMTGFQDNVRFGDSEWRTVFDGQQDEYTLGQNLPSRPKV